MTPTAIRTPIAFAVFCAAACSVYGPELLERDGPRSNVDAAAGTGGRRGGGGASGAAGANRGGVATDASSGSGATGDAAGGAPNPCGGSLTVPPRPEREQVADASVDVGDIVLAMYTVDVGDRTPNAVTPPQGYLDIGLDIDGVCTSPENPTAGRCRLSDWATGTLDGPQGVDNAVGPFFQAVRDIAGVAFSSDQFTRQIQAGDTNLVYRIRGYNGQPNDDQVGVAAFVAAPFTLGKDGGAGPRWDGTDIWPVASESLEVPDGTDPLESPQVVDGTAYVADGRLVATFARFSARIEIGVSALSTSRIYMELSGARIACDLVSDDGGNYRADDCTLAGRWQANHLLKQLSHFADPTSASGFDPICTDNTLYTSFKNRICRGTDVAEAGTEEGSPCNALSIGLGFTARAAGLGNVHDLDPIVDRCPADTEPRSDCCETLTDGVSACP